MTAALTTHRRLSIECGYLPPRIRALLITGQSRRHGWLADAFAQDSASEVQLEEVVGMAAGVARLRDDVFDAVLVSHEEGLDALELLDALRGCGADEQSLIVIGGQSEQELTALCFEAGADAYVCVSTATTRALIWTVARAIERRQLRAETRRLEQAESRRLELERDEATRLLQQQRDLLGEAAGPEEAAEDRAAAASDGLSKTLVEHYRELLRTYVIMGSGSLCDEVEALANQLAAADVTPRQTLAMHLQVLENMIQGLGNRSARHVMNRSDMLILEVTVHLCERYQRRNPSRPPTLRQMLLPGLRG